MSVRRLPGELIRGARLLAALPGLVRRPLTAVEARRRLEERLANRGRHLIELARGAIFGRETSPYARLLAAAGCRDPRDLETLVAREGVEGALADLLRRGVYLTVDELKGRRPVERGSLRFEVDPSALAHPAISPQLFFRSSGSRGSATVVPLAVEHYRERAVQLALTLEARGGLDWRHALWLVPGGAAAFVLLPHAAIGRPPAAWFSPLAPRDPGLAGAYRRSERLLRWGARLGGCRLPRPRPAAGDGAVGIARWLADTVERGETPHLVAFPSAVAELCAVARREGIDLAGARFSIGGEPVTETRLASVRAAGAEASPHYGSMETGFLAEGCLEPAAPDDLHLVHDLHALVGAPAGHPDLPADALVVTSLLPRSPLVLMNVSLGDRARLERRACGCPLDRLGWTTHLSAVRSFEKLTAGGMTLHDADLEELLERRLPARFGGAAVDYQLAEDEDADGSARLLLRVHPRVGAVDEAAAAALVAEALAAPGGAATLASRLLLDDGRLRIDRLPPLAGATGKILHLVAPSPERPVA